MVLRRIRPRVGMRPRRARGPVPPRRQGGEGDSQILAVPSRLAEAMSFPSGLNATARTQFRWPRRVWISPVALRQTLTVESVVPQARESLSGLKATPCAAAVSRIVRTSVQED